MDSIEVMNHRKFVDSVTSDKPPRIVIHSSKGWMSYKTIQSGMNLKGYLLVQSVFALKVESY